MESAKGSKTITLYNYWHSSIRITLAYDVKGNNVRSLKQEINKKRKTQGCQTAVGNQVYFVLIFHSSLLDKLENCF